MIAYAIVILTNLEDLKVTSTIEVRYGTEILNLDGEVVRAFVRCANNGYETFPWLDVLAEGLELISPFARPIYRHLYEEMKDKI